MLAQVLLFQAKLAGGHGGGALGQLLPPGVLTAAEAAWRQSVSTIDAMKVGCERHSLLQPHAHSLCSLGLNLSDAC